MANGYGRQMQTENGEPSAWKNLSEVQKFNRAAAAPAQIPAFDGVTGHTSARQYRASFSDVAHKSPETALILAWVCPQFAENYPRNLGNYAKNPVGHFE